jgi:hypothetical protein
MLIKTILNRIEKFKSFCANPWNRRPTACPRDSVQDIRFPRALGAAINSTILAKKATFFAIRCSHTRKYIPLWFSKKRLFGGP